MPAAALLLAILSCLTAPEAVGQDSLRVSLITAAPGPEVYELYGHTALRIRGCDDGVPFDSVWNYGVFDYEEPNFVGRFVAGDLNYAVSGYPFQWFLPEYERAGRTVTEQTLDLTAAQARTLRRNLQINCLPQNRKYRYDYVRNNCSTRVSDRLEEVLGVTLLSPDAKATFPTYRAAMKHYHSHYPWYDLGIDLALGLPVDTLITPHDEGFLPLTLSTRVAGARLPDGRPLVSQTNILYAGVPDATLPPTPWWKGPVFWGWVLFVLTVVYTVKEWRAGKSYRWGEALFFLWVGLAGCLIAYLALFSSHEAARPNLLLVWLNPLALAVPACIWSRRTRPLAVAYMIANIIALCTLSAIWPFQAQTWNIALWPLIATDIALSAAYAGIYIRARRPVLKNKRR